MLGLAVITQPLNILFFLFWQPMTRNIELESAAQSDIQDLNTPANGENRQPTLERH